MIRYTAEGEVVAIEHKSEFTDNRTRVTIRWDGGVPMQRMPVPLPSDSTVPAIGAKAYLTLGIEEDRDVNPFARPT